MFTSFSRCTNCATSSLHVITNGRRWVWYSILPPLDEQSSAIHVFRFEWTRLTSEPIFTGDDLIWQVWAKTGASGFDRAGDLDQHTTARWATGSSQNLKGWMCWYDMEACAPSTKLQRFLGCFPCKSIGSDWSIQTRLVHEVWVPLGQLYCKCRFMVCLLLLYFSCYSRLST